MAEHWHTTVSSMLIALLLLVCLGTSDGVPSIRGESCYSKNDVPGKCVTFPECYPYMKLLKERPIAKSTLRDIVDLTCVFDLLHPLICCPEDDIISFEFGYRSSIAGSNKFPKYSNHTNFGLLPPISDCSVRKTGNDVIVQSDRATRGEYPWMVLLGYLNPRTNAIDFLCGGTIINKRYILTAAHCTGIADGPRPVIARVAEHDLVNDPDCSNEIGTSRLECSYIEDVYIEKVLPHPKFDFGDSSYVQNHDIALIRLSKDLIFNDFIRPVCLPFVSDYKLFGFPPHLEDAAVSLVAGWGKSSRRNHGSTVIHTVPLRIKSNQECSLPNFSKRTMTAYQVCAGGDEAACGADSGGPLMVVAGQQYSPPKLIQVGVTSFGPKYCNYKVSSIHARVSKYLRWILDTIEP